MTLIWLITLESLVNNIRIYAKHVRTSDNGWADVLSRGHYDKFLLLSQKLNKKFDKVGTDIPHILTDIESWWIFNKTE